MCTSPVARARTNERGRLAAGVAARVDQQGQEEDERHDCLDGVLECGDAGARKDVHEHERQQPSDAPAVEQTDGRVLEAHAQRGHGRHAVEILGGLLLGHVQQVVHGHDPDEHAVGVDDG
jgi:hypothetical protein